MIVILECCCLIIDVFEIKDYGRACEFCKCKTEYMMGGRYRMPSVLQVIEYALGLLPTQERQVLTPTQAPYSGQQVQVCFSSHVSSSSSIFGLKIVELFLLKRVVTLIEAQLFTPAHTLSLCFQCRSAVNVTFPIFQTDSCY